VRLPQAKSADPVEAAALGAARRELVRVLERPADYFSTVQTAGRLVLVELWHESAFTPQNCAVRGADGKSRTLTYDANRQRLVGTKIW
jgi:hypothetical protein